MLIRTQIVGSKHHPDAISALRALGRGDTVILRREPDNRYDPNSSNQEIAAAMDAGIQPAAKLSTGAVVEESRDGPRVTMSAKVEVSWPEPIEGEQTA
jgi:hypothetical protein